MQQPGSGSRNITVVVRTKPSASFAGDNFGIDETGNIVQVSFSGNGGPSSSNHGDGWRFRVDKVLHNESQAKVYEFCGAPAVQEVLEGYNACVMAYGQTGAGKTFTVVGPPGMPGQAGLIPRTLKDLFAGASGSREWSYSVHVSAVEIYNDVMMDLLRDARISMEPLQIIDDSRSMGGASSSSVVVRNLTRREVENEGDAMQSFIEAEASRAVAAHAVNLHSSRSHFIFTLYVKRRAMLESAENIVHSKLHLVDLAGSERLKKTQSAGKIVKEATYINKSLSFLEQVVLALGEKERDHVPYRSSKLTHFLKDSLGGNCRSLLIANIWTEAIHLEETVSTLRFATRMMRVSNEVVQNVEKDPVLLIRKYERDIKDLKRELALKDILGGRTAMSYDSLSTEELQEMAEQARAFLNGSLGDIDIVSIRQVRSLFDAMRRIYQAQQNSSTNSSATHNSNLVIPEAYPLQNQPSKKAHSDSSQQPHSSYVQAIDIGLGEDVEDSSSIGFVVGLAADQQPRAIPNTQTLDRISAASVDNRNDTIRTTVIVASDGHFDVVADSKTDEEAAKRQAAFTFFKATAPQGVEIERKFAANRKTLKEAKLLQKSVVDEVKRHAEGQRNEELLKTSYAALQDAKAKVESLNEESRKVKTELLFAFERWFAEEYLPQSVAQ